MIVFIFQQGKKNYLLPYFLLCGVWLYPLKSMADTQSPQGHYKTPLMDTKIASNDCQLLTHAVPSHKPQTPNRGSLQNLITKECFLLKDNLPSLLTRCDIIASLEHFKPHTCPNTPFVNFYDMAIENTNEQRQKFEENYHQNVLVKEFALFQLLPEGWIWTTNI